MKSYLYLSYLGLVFILTYFSIIYAKRYAANKIKIIYMILFELIFIRNIVFFYTFCSNNLNNLYMIKGIVYLNLLCFPAGAFICYYIFLRNNKFNFNKILMIIGMIFISYVANVYLNQADIKLIDSLGYIFVSSNLKFMKVYGIIVYGFIAALSVGVIKRKASNKIGGIFILISAVISMVSSFLFYSSEGMIIIYLSELLWSITMFYSLLKFKKLL